MGGANRFYGTRTAYRYNDADGFRRQYERGDKRPKMNLNENGKIIISKQVQLKPYIKRTFKQFDLMTDEELYNNAGGTLIVDTESYPNYFLIAFKCCKTGKIVRFEIKPDQDIYFNERKLSWILQSYTLVGFNIIKYDLPLIWLAYTYQDTKLIKEVSDDIIFNNIYYLELYNKYKFKAFQTSHIDLIEICPLRGSLKLYGARIHSPRIQDLPFDVNKDLTEVISNLNTFIISYELSTPSFITPM
jgi:hypothetical protein